MANQRWPLYCLNLLVITIIISLNLNACHAVSASTIIDSKTQQELDRVLELPGQNFNVTFSHYSGYVTVNEDAGRALFYWFFEAVDDPQSKPLLLWLNGGPGCSSIAYGEAEEIGPFHIHPDGKTLYLNPYSWNQGNLQIFYFMIPPGVGFSYSNTTSDLLNHGDKRTASDSLTFLLKWFERFPQYKGRDFYMSGESYAGHYVPQLSQAIVRYNWGKKEKAINLKGYMVGNALTDDYHDYVGVFQFMWAAGLISDQTYRKLNLLCDFQSFVHTSDSCDKILDIASEELGNIDPYSIYTPPCTANISQTNQSWRKMLVSENSVNLMPLFPSFVYSNSPYEVLQLAVLSSTFARVGRVSEKYDPCTKEHSTVYFNHPEVQKALHVSPELAPKKWEIYSKVINNNWKDSPRTVLDVYRELINAGLRIWVFSGDTDAVIPVTSTRYSINALKLPTVKPWHAWYDGGQVGGWTQEYAGLTFVVVRGAGHEVPLHKPNLALTLVKAFLSGTSMPTPELVSSS